MMKLFLCGVLSLALFLTACTATDLSQLEGFIENVDSVEGEITIVLEDGRVITLTISTETPGGEALEEGGRVSTTFDPSTNQVTQIRIIEDEFKGTIVRIGDDQALDVELQSGRVVTVKATDATVIEREDDVRGAFSDLQLNQDVEVEINSSTNEALKIEIEEEKVKVEGRITDTDGQAKTVTVLDELGRSVTLQVTKRTRIELEDGFRGTFQDLQSGAEVEVKYLPPTSEALKIEVEEDEQELKGIIKSIDLATGKLVVETRRGSEIELQLTPGTKIEIEDGPDLVEELRVGDEVEVEFIPSSSRVLEIEVEEKG